MKGPKLLAGRCCISVEEETPDALTIRDESTTKDTFWTVTNGAEVVVKFLWDGGLLKPNMRLLYYDSYGELDEIVWEGEGHFLGFKVGPRGV